MTVLGKSLAQYVHIVGVSTGVFIRVELCFPEKDYRVAVGQAPRTPFHRGCQQKFFESNHW